MNAIASLSGLDAAFAAERREWNVYTAFVVLPPDLRGALAWLAPGERQAFAGFRFERRRRDWLAGRLAVKTAALTLLRAESGPCLAPQEIEVRRAPTGRPELRIHGAPADGLQATISHSGGAAGAAAFRERDAGTVGLDLERIADVDTALLPIAFTDAEVEWIHEAASSTEHRERILRLWTAKEAVLKALGVGLSEPLRSVEVAPGPPGEAWAALASRPVPAARLLVRTVRADDWVAALAVSGLVEPPSTVSLRRFLPQPDSGRTGLPPPPRSASRTPSSETGAGS